MSQSRTTAQNRRLHQLITQLGLSADDKAVLVESFTGERTTHSAEMLYNECEGLIKHLESQVTPLRGDRRGAMRCKILAICHQMGWYLREEGILQLKDSKPVLDWQHIDGFCKHKGPYKKPLRKHNYKELIVLVSVFEQVLKHQMNKV